MNIENLIDPFIEAVGGWKTNETPGAYRSKLRRIANQFGNREIRTITTRDLEAFTRGLLEELSPWTVKSTLTTIRHLFKWATENGYIERDPAAALHIPNPPAPDPKPITPETVSRLLKAASEHGEPWQQARDTAIICWLRDTGGRSCGLLSAMLDGLDLKRGRITTIEKGQQRTLYINDATRRALKSWLRLRGELIPITKHVFISSKTRRGLTRPGLRNVLRVLALWAGVEGRWNAHAFRHAFARDCLQAHADLSQVAQLMGHSSVAITALYYARWADHELKRVHSKVSPGAKLKLPNDT